MPTRAQAFNHWFHGLGGPPAEPDMYAAFKAGWDAQQAEIDRMRTELQHVTESCRVFREEALRVRREQA